MVDRDRTAIVAQTQVNVRRHVEEMPRIGHERLQSLSARQRPRWRGWVLEKMHMQVVRAYARGMRSPISGLFRLGPSGRAMPQCGRELAGASRAACSKDAIARS